MTTHSATRLCPAEGCAIVVGADADWDQVAAAAAAASVVLVYALEPLLRVSALDDGIECREISVIDNLIELDVEAHEWSWSLVQALDKGGHHSSELLRLVRRSLSSRTLHPIALARARARRVCEFVVPGSEVRTYGIGAVDRLALSEHFRVLEVRAATPAGAPSASSAPSLRLARAAVRVVAATWHQSTQDLSLRMRSRAQRNPARGSVRAAAVFAKYEAHMRFLRSATQELGARGWGCVLVDMSLEKSLAAEFGVEPTRYYDYYHEATIRRVVAKRSRGRRFTSTGVRQWARDAGLSSFADMIAGNLSTLYYLRAPAALAAHARVQKVVGQSVSITANETVLEVEARTFLDTPERVPSVNVQHGTITRTKRRAQFEYDAFCVFGEAYAELLEAGGTRADRIRVVGNPLFDGLAEGDDRPNTHPSRQATLRRLSLDEERFTILFCAQHTNATITDALLYRTLKPVLEYVDDRDDTQLVVKWHPLGSGKERGYESALSEHPKPVVAHVREDILLELLSAADCVVLYSSTTGFEAASLRKPVVVVNPTKLRDIVPFVREGTALEAKDAAEFAECIERIRSGNAIPPERYAALDERYHYRRDGKAGARIADVCEELAARFAADESSRRT